MSSSAPRESPARRSRPKAEPSPTLPPDGIPSIYVYLHAKAEIYLKTSPARYRKRDFFAMPSRDWPPELLSLVRKGMEQIVRFQGWKRDNAFTGLGIEAFYALAETLHFHAVKVRTRDLDAATFLDEMRLEHLVDGRSLILFNAVLKRSWEEAGPGPSP